MDPTMPTPNAPMEAGSANPIHLDGHPTTPGGPEVSSPLIGVPTIEKGYAQRRSERQLQSTTRSSPFGPNPLGALIPRDPRLKQVV